MTIHLFQNNQVHRWQETNCDRVLPIQLTFNLDEEMTGFVFQISGPSTSTRFETPPNAALYVRIYSYSFVFSYLKSLYICSEQ